MKLVVPSIISEFQGAFVHGRQIQDGILIAFDLIDSKLRMQETGLICKVDFEKAFDYLNFLLKGKTTDLFKSQKGIRQDDPISPFIFILVAKILSLMLKKAASDNLISGFKVSQNGTTISHLQFADDLVVFLNDDELQVQNLKHILTVFEMISGLKVNYRKSTMVGLGQLHNGEVFADSFGCSSSQLPMNYLEFVKEGTLLTVRNGNNIHFWEDVWDNEILDVANLLQVIGEPPQNAGEDVRVWRYGDTFSVANPYTTLEEGGLLRFPDKQLWNSTVPLKVSFLVWNLCYKGAPTLDMLFRAGLVKDTNCLFCNHFAETNDHLFLHCTSVASIWSYFLHSFCVGWALAGDVRMNLWEWGAKKNSSRLKEIWSLLSFAIWWTIWKERNNRLYNNHSRNINQLIIAVKCLLYSWAVKSDIFSGFSLSTLICNWDAVIH
ncbi:uncharacterized protein LOC113279336 [Papaver somniferum]|uniref:uncharacterized protein LOC113279336 n=1 Tax=Papaver somniferum TaxID=3469 RepID=UPI000E6FD566|nr:uncharacterized protein LOC113279336 [Papaver somniferum]